jgi:hypothetical protein
MSDQRDRSVRIGKGHGKAVDEFGDLHRAGPPPKADQRIDPERIRPELVEAASLAECRINLGENSLDRARRILAEFLAALLADEEAMERALTAFYHPRSCDGRMRAALIAAVTEPDEG